VISNPHVASQSGHVRYRASAGILRS
jgi:hypothetical protein